MTITNANIPGIGGILCGNDTIFITVDEKKDLDNITEQIKRIIR